MVDCKPPRCICVNSMVRHPKCPVCNPPPARGVPPTDAALGEESKAEAIAAALVRFAGYTKDEARACSRLILPRAYAQAARGVDLLRRLVEWDEGGRVRSLSEFIKEARAIAHGVGEFDAGLGKSCKAQSNLKPDADGVSASDSHTFPSHTPMKDTGRNE